jgi:uncharacterized protein
VSPVRVTRIGVTPVKGGHHTPHRSIALTGDGPVGDRVFCLVDEARGRVLRTVENPSLLRTVARWDGERLSVTVPGRPAVDAVPAPGGEPRTVDYWGRPADVELVDGPWSAAYSGFLGHEVRLARAARPGEVVYGGSVSLVTTSSLDRLATEVGHPVDAARFRATFTLDTPGLPAHVEDGWIGRRLRLGSAEVEVRSLLPRCAVLDLDPASGSRRRGVLGALGRYRRVTGEVVFGVDAVVTSAGGVEVGDPCERG